MLPYGLPSSTKIGDQGAEGLPDKRATLAVQSEANKTAIADVAPRPPDGAREL